MQFLTLAFANLLLATYLLADPFTESSKESHSIERPIKNQEISASGSLKFKGQIKIGSVQAGKIKAIHVQENDAVEEGQLLVEIDTGLEDTEVREAEGAYERSLAELDYQEANYRRQKQLFAEKFLSDSTL